MLTVFSRCSCSGSVPLSLFSEEVRWPFICRSWLVPNTCDSKGRLLRFALCTVNAPFLLLSALLSLLPWEWLFLKKVLPLSLFASTLSEDERREASSKWTERMVPMSVRRGGEESLLWASNQLGSKGPAERDLVFLDSVLYPSTGMSRRAEKELEVFLLPLDPWEPVRLSFSSSSSRWLSFSTSSALWSSKPPL